MRVCIPLVGEVGAGDGDQGVFVEPFVLGVIAIVDRGVLWVLDRQM
jgi:hypothetical protein